MKIFIKNMVCHRCKMAVEEVFKNLKIEISSVELGEVETKNDLSNSELKNLSENLENIGFEILEDHVRKQIEKIKTVIIQKISQLDISENFILSEFLVDEFHKDYSSISKNFSQNENVTLEQYFILQKIEKTKELLFYNEFNLTEIAGKLGYKSVQHLSSQFKTSTGFTPSEFKKMKNKNRKSIDFS